MSADPGFDLSRDFLDGLLIQQPQQNEGGKGEVKANGHLHFLPSSPDGTMHTAVVSFSLQIEGVEHPFARAGWRFLFTTEKQFDPSKNAEHAFFQSLMMVGIGKILTQLNNLCMHANLPLVPFQPQQLVRAAKPPTAAGAGGAPSAPPIP
jgi:hypothetical protein